MLTYETWQKNLVIVRGGGDIATGTIFKLFQCGFPVLVLEIANPSCIRRTISFCEAVFDDTPKNVFSHYKELEKMGLAAPQITYIMHALKEKGLAVDADATTVGEAKNSILQALKSVRSPLLRELKGGRTDD